MAAELTTYADKARLLRFVSSSRNGTSLISLPAQF